MRWDNGDDGLIEVRAQVDSMRWEAAGIWQACLRAEGRIIEAIAAGWRRATERRGGGCGGGMLMRLLFAFIIVDPEVGLNQSGRSLTHHGLPTEQAVSPFC